MGANQSNQNKDYLDFKDRIFNWIPEEIENDTTNEKVYDRVNEKFRRSYLSVNHEPYCGPVFNQGNLGSCTANAIAGAYMYKYNLEHDIHSNDEYLNSESESDSEFDNSSTEIINNTAVEFMPSRLFIYYNERAVEHSTSTDSGARIIDGIKSLESNGVCSEKEWPYDISKFTNKPIEECYKDAEKHKCVKYHRVLKTVENLKACIDQGNVIIFGFTVFSSFKDPNMWTSNYIMPSPQINDELLGGHAVLMIGYDDDLECFIIRNSWGADWGNSGDFYMPYKFVMGTFNMRKTDLGLSWWDDLEEQMIDSNIDSDTKTLENNPNFIQPYCSDFYVIDATFDKDTSL